LGADLVGFHTEQYAGDFLGCCSRLLGARVDHARQVVEWQGREVRVGAFPIGIEVDEFSAQATSATTREKVARIRQGLGAAQLVLGVDRLDYSKGILERLRAVDALLERHPELRRKIVFLQIAVPSRTQVQEYRDLKREIDEMVGRVNGRHGAADWTPVRYLYRSIPRPDLVSYYRAADVCLVNPLRDGMNLVAMEYVACQAGKVADRLKDGVLVLSELTGAASVLGDGPLLINPFAIQETAEALERALAMDEGERRTRMEKLLASVRAHDVHGWLERILSAAMQSEKRRGAGARRHDPLH
ncbi:MAG TPA: trehalose-6-phosphate synthase, partial [Thermoanaerobaculia bacterium]|nr:trehalose-6-phosphate synthase [Thermoanaerobaculia bacterium]